MYNVNFGPNPFIIMCRNLSLFLLLFLKVACVAYIIQWNLSHFLYSQDNWDDDDEDEEKKVEVTKTGQFLWNRWQLKI